jgi:putative peptidoglycan lipid II flippase
MIARPGEPAQGASAPESAGRHLTRSATLAGVAVLTSRILGLVRETVLAALFGAGNDMDAYLVAFRIPNLTRDLFAEGAMSSAFVPTFTRHLTRHGKEAAWRLGNNVMTSLAIVTAIVAALCMVFAGPLVSAYAGNFSAVPGKLDLTVRLARIMLPFLPLVSIAAVMMGMLNARQHYFVPSLSPAMFNVASIACAIALVPLMPLVGLPRITAIAIAVLLGGLGQIAVQWPPLRDEGFRFRAVIDRRDEGLGRILLLMGPGTLGLAATQINLFVNTQLATGQGTGAVSWLNYAFRLMYLPIGLFGVSIATAVLPRAAERAAVGEIPELRDTVSRGLCLMLAVNIPAMFGLIVLAHPIAQLLFEHGRFLPSDTLATAAALQLYALGLIGYSTVRILSPVFYAVGRSAVPVIVSTASIVLNLALNLMLVRAMGFRGLALGTSIAALTNGGLLLVLLRRHLAGIGGSHLSMTVAKSAVAATVMAAVAFPIERWLFAGTGGRIVGAVRLLIAILGGLSALAIMTRVLRIREFDDGLSMVRQRVQKLLGR